MQKAQKCEARVSVTSQNGPEARQAAHGVLDALRRRIGFGLNLGDETRLKLHDGWS